MGMTRVLIGQGVVVVVAAVLLLLLHWMRVGDGFALMMVGLIATFVSLAQATTEGSANVQIHYGMIGFLGIIMIACGMWAVTLEQLSGWALLPALIVPVLACYLLGNCLARAMNRKWRFLSKAIAFCFLVLLGSAGLVLLVPFWDHDSFRVILAASVLALAASVYPMSQQGEGVVSRR